MKKNLLLILIMSLATLSFSQQTYTFKTGVKYSKPSKINSAYSKTVVKPKTILAKKSPNVDVKIVNVIDIGTAANVYDFAADLSSVWANEDLNTVSLYHRMGGSLDSAGNVGDLGYDISTDGGNTWNTMIRNFYFGELNGSMPHHGIFNPQGNGDPDNAYIVYNLSGADVNSSGYIHGISSIGDTSARSQVFDASNAYADIHPSAFDITQDGKVFIVSTLFGNALEYQDSLLITKGIWNEDVGEFEYSNTKLEAVVSNNLSQPLDIKVAFGADGQTGYISMIANNGMAQEQSGFTNLYPIYWKTTDGGQTWEGPEYVQLDGPTGLKCIVDHQITDELIYELFGDNPPEREEISYTTAFDHDIAVDNNNQLNIAAVIGLTDADPYSIVTVKGYLKVWDFGRFNDSYWCPSEMGGLNTFRGQFGDLTEDNRLRISKNKEGNYLFFSWLDSDFEGVEENNQPNIFCRGLEVDTRIRTENYIGDEPTNVTLFSDGMWESYFGTASRYAIGSNNEYIIPFVYASFPDSSFLGEVQYKYISDFSMYWPGEINQDFCPCGIVSVSKQVNEDLLMVAKNSPNPFSDKTTFAVYLPKNADLQLKIYNIQGKIVDEKVYESLPAGDSKISYEAGDLKSGLYIYKIIAEGKIVSGKMIVE